MAKKPLTNQQITKLQRRLTKVVGYDIRSSNHFTILDENRYCYAISNAIVITNIDHSNNLIESISGCRSGDIFSFEGFVEKIVSKETNPNIILIHTIENHSQSISLKNLNQPTTSTSLHRIYLFSNGIKFEKKMNETVIIDIDLTNLSETAIVLHRERLVTIWTTKSNELTKISSISLNTSSMKKISCFCESDLLIYGTGGIMQLWMRSNKWVSIDLSLSSSLDISCARIINNECVICGTSNGLVLSYYYPVFKSTVVDQRMSMSVTDIMSFSNKLVVVFDNSILVIYSFTAENMSIFFEIDFIRRHPWQCKIKAIKPVNKLKKFLIAFENGKICKWTQDDPMHVVNIQECRLLDMSLSAIVPTMCLISKQQSCVLYDLETRKTLPHHKTDVLNCMFNPSFANLILIDNNRTMFVYALMNDGSSNEIHAINFNDFECCYPFDICKQGGTLVAVWLGQKLTFIDILNGKDINSIPKPKNLGKILNLEWGWSSSIVYSLHENNVICCWSVLFNTVHLSRISLFKGDISSNICSVPYSQYNLFFGLSTSELYKMTISTKKTDDQRKISLVTKVDSTITFLNYNREMCCLICGFSSGFIRILLFDHFNNQLPVWYNLDQLNGSISHLWSANMTLCVLCEKGPLLVYDIDDRLGVYKMQKTNRQLFCPFEMTFQRSYINKQHEKIFKRVRDQLELTEAKEIKAHNDLDVFIEDTIRNYYSEMFESIQNVCAKTKDEKNALLADDANLCKLKNATKTISECLAKSLANFVVNNLSDDSKFNSVKFNYSSNNNIELQSKQLKENLKVIHDQTRTIEQDTKDEIKLMLEQCMNNEMELLVECERQQLLLDNVDEDYSMLSAQIKERIQSLRPEIEHFNVIEAELNQMFDNLPNHKIFTSAEMINQNFQNTLERTATDTFEDRVHTDVVESKRTYLKYTSHLQEAMIGYGMKDLQKLNNNYILKQSQTIKLSRELRFKGKGQLKRNTRLEFSKNAIANLEEQLQEHLKARELEYNYRRATYNDLVEFLRGKPTRYNIMILHKRRIDELSNVFIDKSYSKAAKAACYEYYVMARSRRQLIEAILRQHKTAQIEERKAFKAARKRCDDMLESERIIENTKLYLPNLCLLNEDLSGELKTAYEENHMLMKKRELLEIRDNLAACVQRYHKLIRMKKSGRVKGLSKDLDEESNVENVKCLSSNLPSSTIKDSDIKCFDIDEKLDQDNVTVEDMLNIIENERILIANSIVSKENKQSNKPFISDFTKSELAILVDKPEERQFKSKADEEESTELICGDSSTYSEQEEAEKRDELSTNALQNLNEIISNELTNSHISINYKDSMD